MTKVYVAKTPLILLDATGKEHRVEAGATVALTPDQYQDVAAHVTLLETDEPVPPEQTEAGQSEQPESEQPETKNQSKAGRRTKGA